MESVSIQGRMVKPEKVGCVIWSARMAVGNLNTE